MDSVVVGSETFVVSSAVPKTSCANDSPITQPVNTFRIHSPLVLRNSKAQKFDTVKLHNIHPLSVG